ncbi:MAG: HEPN domain-containing protein [Nitrososphaerales archaeon]
MSHLHEVNLLKRRAKGFLERAIDSLNSSYYDLAAFLSEQAVQLYLKSILLEKVGDYPRTHSISTILSILKRFSNCENLIKLLEEKKLEVSLMEDAYIAARYFVREYSKNEAEILINLAKEVLKYGEVC